MNSFYFFIFLPLALQMLICNGMASEMQRMASTPATLSAYNAQQALLRGLIHEAADCLKDFQIYKAIEILKHAYKDGAKVADLIAELILLHDRDVDRAKEWFKKSESSMGLFYLWILEKANRSFYRAKLDTKTDSFAAVVSSNFALFEKCLMVPHDLERYKQAEIFLKEAISKSSMSSTFFRQTYDAYLLLAHYACFPTLEELERGSSSSYRSPIQAAFDVDGIRYILDLLYVSANRMRLRFICYVFYLENNSPEEAILFCNAQAQAYFAIRRPRAEDSILRDSLSSRFSKELVFPQALIAEEYFFQVVLDKLIYQNKLTHKQVFGMTRKQLRQLQALNMMKMMKKPTGMQHSEIVAALEVAALEQDTNKCQTAARLNFLNCSIQLYYPEIRALALIRLGQDQCLQDSGPNIREAYRYFHAALMFVRENHLDCYFEKWCSVNLFCLAEYVLAYSTSVQIPWVLPGVLDTFVYSKIDHEIKKRLFSMNILQHTNAYYADYLKLVSLICRERGLRLAVLSQFLGSHRYYKKKTWL